MGYQICMYVLVLVHTYFPYRSLRAYIRLILKASELISDLYNHQNILLLWVPIGAYGVVAPCLSRLRALFLVLVSHHVTSDSLS